MLRGVPTISTGSQTCTLAVDDLRRLVPVTPQQDLETLILLNYLSGVSKGTPEEYATFKAEFVTLREAIEADFGNIVAAPVLTLFEKMGSPLVRFPLITTLLKLLSDLRITDILG